MLAKTVIGCSTYSVELKFHHRNLKRHGGCGVAYIDLIVMNPIFKNTAISFLSKALDTSAKSVNSNKNPIITTAKSIYRHPVKLLATYIAAPYLVWCIARRASNPNRKYIAALGLFISVLLAWAAGTFLGTFTGAMLITSGFGAFWGISFFIGTSISAILSVAFSVAALNASSYLFLQLSSEDVIEHLRSIIENENVTPEHQPEKNRLTNTQR